MGIHLSFLRKAVNPQDFIIALRTILILAKFQKNESRN